MSSANLAALGGRVRELRAERSWSQEHLAGAAGLSLRTVQRVESGYACANDTLLALAAAFAVPAAELTKLIPPPARAEDRFLGLTHRQATVTGLVLATPALMFVVANLASVVLGAKWGAAYIESAAKLGLDSPVVVLGGLILSLLLNFFQIVRFDIRRPGVGIIIDRLQLHLALGPILVLLAVGASLAILVAYLVAENLGHMVADLIAG